MVDPCIRCAYVSIPTHCSGGRTPCDSKRLHTAQQQLAEAQRERAEARRSLKTYRASSLESYKRIRRERDDASARVKAQAEGIETYVGLLKQLTAASDTLQAHNAALREALDKAETHLAAFGMRDDSSAAEELNSAMDIVTQALSTTPAIAYERVKLMEAACEAAKRARAVSRGEIESGFELVEAYGDLDKALAALEVGK